MQILRKHHYDYPSYSFDEQTTGHILFLNLLYWMLQFFLTFSAQGPPICLEIVSSARENNCNEYWVPVNEIQSWILQLHFQSQYFPTYQDNIKYEQK